MRDTVLGRTGLKVKKLGFGGIPIQRVSDEEGVRIIRLCFRSGINFFDTARAYTVSEERVGKALHDVRDEVFIATKTLSRTKSGVLADLAVSLKNLRTDWIDIYQIHNVMTKEVWEQVTQPDGALQALYQAHDEGQIDHFGITSHNPAFLTEIVKEDIFETIQFPYNYLTQMPAEELLPLSQKMNVGTIIMKPFGGGALTNVKTALNFLLGNEAVDVVIPGMMQTTDVLENIAIASGVHTLTPNEQKLIEQDRLELGTQFCRACEYCQPCPQEIPISIALRWEAFEKRMGWSPKVKNWFQNVLEKAPTCIDCGDCEARCPYGLPIRELLSIKTDSLEKAMKERS